MVPKRTDITEEELLAILDDSEWKDTGYPETLMLTEWKPIAKALEDKHLVVWSTCCLGLCLKKLKVN